jgi:hypothetical protein
MLLLALVALAGCAGTGGTRSGGTGSISGKIAYPSELTPAMRICALPAAGAAPVCIDSAAGQTAYRIERLAAGDYQLVARLNEGEMRVGGHMQPVQCVRAPCPDLLKTVSLAAGARLTGIDLNEFYAARADFPPLP